MGEAASISSPVLSGGGLTLTQASLACEALCLNKDFRLKVGEKFGRLKSY